MSAQSQNPSSLVGIAFMCAGIVAVSFNDMMFKFLSGDYALHQLVFIRSAIAVCFSLALVRFEGGFRLLKTGQPGLHALRCLLIVLANMTFYAALASLPLGEATALFFLAPLIITLLSVPVLGETVGPFRLGAVFVGFVGVLIMTRPWADADAREAPFFIYMLPLLAATFYGSFQILTRKLGGTTRASVLAVYIQSGFLIVSLGFFLVAGDGRFGDGSTNESIRFLLRAWVWPPQEDLALLGGLGLCTAIVGYSFSQAYRLSDAALVAPFEYLGLPLALFWGWIMFREWPDPVAFGGIALILSSGLFIFLRERALRHRVSRTRGLHGR
ncbi:MAG: DMT family transporter [Pseudomonadota bacterium]